MVHPACLSRLISHILPSIHQYMSQWHPLKSLWDFSGCPVGLRYQLRLPVLGFYSCESLADIFSIRMSFR